MTTPQAPQQVTLLYCLLTFSKKLRERGVAPLYYWWHRLKRHNRSGHRSEDRRQHVLLVGHTSGLCFAWLVVFGLVYVELLSLLACCLWINLCWIVVFVGLLSLDWYVLDCCLCFCYVSFLSLFRLKPLWMVSEPGSDLNLCLLVFTIWSLKEVTSEGARVAQIFKLVTQVAITYAKRKKWMSKNAIISFTVPAFFCNP